MPIRSIVLDIDGTLMRDRTPIEGAVSTVEQLQQHGYRIVYCTQENYQSDQDIERRLMSAGFPVPPGAVVSAGTVAVDYILKTHPGVRIYVMGSKRLKEPLVKAGLTVLSEADGETADVVLVGIDPDVSLDRLATAAQAVRSGAQFYVTNMDRGYPLEDRIIPSAGSLAMAIAFTARRQPRVLGKPSRWMGAAIRRVLSVEAEQIAVVGDQLAQDVALGYTVGGTSILVLSGLTQAEEVQKTSSRKRPHLVLPSVAHLLPWLIGRE